MFVRAFAQMTSNRPKKESKTKQRAEKKIAKSSAPRSKPSDLYLYLYPTLFALLSILLYYLYQRLWIQSPILKPFPAPFVRDASLFGSEYRDEMLWGTYRPGLYCGLRMRVPSSLMAGLMWVDPSWYQNIDHLRHLARQEDGVQFGWTHHNGKDLAIQHLADGNYSIQTSWVKRVDDESGPGGDWTLRISAKDDHTPHRRIALFFYLVDERGPDVTAKNEIAWDLLDESLGPHSQRILTGHHPVVGNWHLGLHSRNLDDVTVHKLGAPLSSFHNLTDQVISIVYEHLSAQYQSQGQKDLQKLVVSLPEPPLWLESSMEHPNFAIFQVSGTLPLEMEFVFLTGDRQSQGERFHSITGTKLDKLLKERAEIFDSEFVQKMENKKSTPEHREALKSVLSNVLGSIGYFYGSSQVRILDKNENFQIQDHFQTPLFTGTPSRSFFPRGFLWDEGFHQVSSFASLFSHICILAHHLKMEPSTLDGHFSPLARSHQHRGMDSKILGEEARSRVPSEFIVQDPSVGNPPTLFLPLLELASHSNTTEFFKMAWDRLVKWFGWMVENHGYGDELNFRWTARDDKFAERLNPLTLDSGLDDYPRASHASEWERHLDLRCWIGLAAEAMIKIGERIEIKAQQLEQYIVMRNQIKDIERMKKLHYDPERGWFVDFGLHSEHITLGKAKTSESLEETSQRIVHKEPIYQLIPHFGYVSLFPLFMHLLSPKDPILEQQLQLLEDRSLLWTDYGLRSLSKSSSFYQKFNSEHDGPYWRGAIWINMNYLALKGLEYYSQEPGPYTAHAHRLHKELRSNLITNVLKQLEKTGFIWEQYDDKTGKGKGCRPFTGWSALILLM